MPAFGPFLRSALSLSLIVLLTTCGGEDLVLPDESVPASIVMAAGNDQNGIIGQPLADSLAARVLDSGSRPVPGQQITFEVMTGGGQVVPATAVTGADGRAAVRWTLGAAAGTQQVQAKATGGAAPDNLTVVFRATARASSAAELVEVSGAAQSGTAGSTLEDSLIVKTVDAAGNPAAGVSVTWAASAGGAVSAAATATGPDGRAGIKWTLGTTAGPQTATATSPGLSGSPLVFSASATVGSAGKLVVVRQPSEAGSSGAAFAQQPQVQIQDAHGNDVADPGEAISVAIASGPEGATLSGNPIAATSGAGLATFAGLGITGPAGSYTLNFTGINLAGVTSRPITLGAGAATRLAFTAQPTNAGAGAAIAPPVAVTVQDALGQTVPSDHEVTVAIGANAAGGTLAGTRTARAVNGVATFSTLAINRAGSGYTLTASAAGLSGATSTPFNVGVGGAATIAAHSTMPATTVAGGTVVPDPAVLITDVAGNPVAGVDVTFAEVNGGGVVGGAQVTNAQGIATVDSWTIGTLAGTQYQIRATVDGLTGSPVTFSTRAAAGSAGKLVMVQQPSSSASSAVPFAQQPTVQIQDANGNDVASAGRAITAVVASGPGGVIVGTAIAATNAAGLATFTNLAITGPAGEYTLNFGGVNLTNVASGPIMLAAGAATRLAFTLQPSSTVAGAAIAPPPRVTIQDALGQTVAATNPITISIGANPGTGTLTGTRTDAAANGVASFPNLKINRAGSGYTLTASAAGLSTATSAPFNITGGSAATIAASSPLPATTVAGVTVAPAPAVRVEDASGNPIAGATVVFGTVNGGSVSGAEQMTNAQGIATVGSWTVGTVAGTQYQLTAASAGLSGSPVTFSTTATAGSASALTIETEPASVGQSGQALNPQPVVQLRDANGNAVSQGGVSITAAIASGPAGELDNEARTTNTNGRATFSGLEISGPAGTYTLRFSGPNIGGVESGAITLSSGGATKLGITTQPSTTTENGAVFAVQPVVQLQDASGNAVGIGGVVVQASISSGGGGLGGTTAATTGGDGRAVFTDLKITGAVGVRTLSFSAPIVGSVVSRDISVTVGPVDASRSTIEASPSAITAGGDGAAITVIARDQSSNLIVGASVTPAVLSGDGAFDPGSATTGASGTAGFVYTTGAAGIKEIGAAINGTAIAARALITVSGGPPSNATSSLAVSEDAVAAGETVTVTLTAQDAFGNPVSGATVEFASSLEGSLGTATTNGVGQAVLDLVPQTAGSHALSAQITSGAIALPEPEQAALTVSPGAPSEARSSIFLNAPTVLACTGRVGGTVTVRDAFGNPVPGAALTFTAPLAGGTWDGATDGLGTTTFEYSGCRFGIDTIVVSATRGSEVATLRAHISVVTAPVDLTSSGIYPESLEHFPPSVGIPFVLRFVVHAVGGGDVAGARLEFQVTGEAVTLLGPPMGWTGPAIGGLSVTELLLSTPRAQILRVRGLVNGVDLGREFLIEVRAGHPSGQSLVETESPVTIGQPSAVSVTLRDEYGNPVPNWGITLSEASGTATLVQPASPTDAEGRAFGSFMASEPGNYTVRAGTADGTLFEAVVEVTP